MEEGKNRQDNSFLSGLVLGGVVGAGLALLLGQEDGEKTRKVLIKKGKAALKNLGEILEEGQADLKNHWGSGEQREEKEKKEEPPVSVVKKATQRFFRQKGKTLR